MLGIYVRTSREDDKKESPIEQQKKAGIQFAVDNKYRYEIYEDKGVSGFKIANDDNDPFKNRPRFTDLINDIKAKNIDKVWVWEHSRLSRNQYSSAIIFNIFEKNNVKVFEKDKEFILNDPQSKIFRGVLDALAEYERSQIVGRTTRGLHNRIDQGKRTFGKLYGYRKSGIDPKGYQVLETVESEIENIKYGYKRIQEGATLRQLTLELYNNKSFDRLESLRISRLWYKILRHFSYTGFELNMAGLEIMKKFDNFEINDLSVLNDEKYRTKSSNYPYQLIPIEKWIKVVERLRINRQMRKDGKTRKASKDLATGIITCSGCGQKYYSHTHTSKKNGKEYDYVYYKHYAAMQNVIGCPQKKSFAVGNMNEIFKLFYFYFYMIFDNTAELLMETQRIIKGKKLKLTEQIKQLERNGKQLEKQIVKFNLALDDTDDTGEIKILARRISEAEENSKANYEDVTNLKIELEQLNEQYAGTETLNAYYNVKDRIINFFRIMNLEEQRESIIKAVKKCLVFQHHIVIDTGVVLFVFDTRIAHKFKDAMLSNLDKDAVYKKYIVEKLSDREQLVDINDLNWEPLSVQEMFKDNEMTIYNCKLTGAEKHFNMEVSARLFKEYGIGYDVSNHLNVLFFTFGT
jgi:DNA invertase Pin-like site-specific DNA recombinase